MDYEKLRAHIAALRKTAADLEVLLPYEEEVVIVDEDFLPPEPPAPPRLIGDGDFREDLLKAIEKVLNG